MCDQSHTAPVYTEPEDYIPKEIREALGLGEFAAAEADASEESVYSTIFDRWEAEEVSVRVLEQTPDEFEKARKEALRLRKALLSARGEPDD